MKKRSPLKLTSYPGETAGLILDGLKTSPLLAVLSLTSALPALLAIDRLMCTRYWGSETLPSDGLILTGLLLKKHSGTEAVKEDGSLSFFTNQALLLTQAPREDKNSRGLSVNIMRSGTGCCWVTYYQITRIQYLDGLFNNHCTGDIFQ